MKGAERAGVLRQLAWATIHDKAHLKHYFSVGQAAHLRGAEGTVLCTDGSVHLDVLENGHTKASLGLEEILPAVDCRLSLTRNKTDGPT
eukprot:1037200-Rhodomonas_salina.1